MAKKKADTEEGLSKTEMVRRAVRQLGEHCSTQQVIEFVKETYDEELSEATASNYTSNAKKELREGSGGERTKRTRAAKGAEEVVNNEPTMKECLLVKQLADDGEGVEAMTKSFHALRAVAEQVGGFEKLGMALDFLTQVSEK